MDRAVYLGEKRNLKNQIAELENRVRSLEKEYLQSNAIFPIGPCYIIIPEQTLKQAYAKTIKIKAQKTRAYLIHYRIEPDHNVRPQFEELGKNGERTYKYMIYPFGKFTLKKIPKNMLKVKEVDPKRRGAQKLQS